MVFDEFRKKLIQEMEMKRDSIISMNIYNTSGLRSIFEISDENTKLYVQLMHSLNNVAMQNVQEMLCQLFAEYKYDCETLDNKNDFDLCATINNVKTNILVQSSFDKMYSSRYIVNLFNRVCTQDKPLIVLFFIKVSSASRRINRSINHKLEELACPHSIKCYLFEDFLSIILGGKALKEFRIAMGSYSQEMNEVFGYQLTELATRTNMEKFKIETKKKIEQFDYDFIYRQRQQNPDSRKLYYDKFDTIKNNYIKLEKYSILLGDADFARSFISSEWLFQKYHTIAGYDNTYIVTGYLKSIEQLLWSIVYLTGQDRPIGAEQITLTNENADIVKTKHATLGSLEYFLGRYTNSDLYEPMFGRGTTFVINYLQSQIREWRTEERNGYFHKENLTADRVNEIRNSTFYLYFLIIGSLALNPETIEQLKS